MTAPITIEIIIHYYTQGSTDFQDSPAFKSNCETLLKEGMLIECKDGNRKYDANREACEAYINALCKVPFPKQKWVIPNLIKL